MSESANSPVSQRDRWGAWLIVLALVVLLGALLRIPGLFTDFWLDEIWSFLVARQLHSVKDLLFSEPARIDNNHLLNTWFLFILGDRPNWWIYRLPALVGGIGATVVAAHVMSRWGRLEALIAALLVSLSFPFVAYSSEARGYALASFFAMLAFDALLADLARPRWWTVLLFNIACVLGFLSHLTFVHFYLAAMFWSVLRIRRNTAGIPSQVRRWLRLNAFPVALCAALYLTFIRHLIIGGAAATRPIVVIASSLSFTVGGPENGPVTFAVAALVAVCLILTLMALVSRRDDVWLFYLLAVVIAPLFLLTYNLLLSQRPQPLMLRYFLVALTFLLLALSQGSAALWRSGSPPGRVIVVVLLGAFTLGSFFPLLHFLSYGRGGYVAALERMVNETRDTTMRVASDNEFPTSMVIEFYRRRVLPPGRQIDMYQEAAPRPQPPQWVIVTKPSITAHPPTTMSHPSGAVYDLDSSYPASSLSGTAWCLYRLDIAASIERMNRGRSR